MNKRIVCILVMYLMILGTVFAATATLNTPADNYNITTSPYTLNVTLSDITSGTAAYNCTFYYETDGTYTIIATVQNDTNDDTEFTYSWTWTSVADGLYDINATCYIYNVSSGALYETVSDENTNIALDDTAPSISSVTYTNKFSTTNITISDISASDTGFTDGVWYCEVQFYPSTTVNATDAGTDKFNLSYAVSKGRNKFRVRCCDKHGWCSSWTSWKDFRRVLAKGEAKQVFVKSKGVPAEKGKDVSEKAKQLGGGIVSGVMAKIQSFINWILGLFK